MNNPELQLRAEIEELRHQLEEQKRLLDQRGRSSHGTAHPPRTALTILGLLVLILITAAFFAGYLPRHKREQTLIAEAAADQKAIPIANVVMVKRAQGRSELILPGNIQAITEGPVLARASGYIKKRYVDIGDRVKENQLLAEIEAHELDQQIRQAQAGRDQANSSLEQASASLQQGRTNEQLARVTADRWKNLAGRGVVSRQENDQYQSQYQAQQSNVQALEKAVSAARGNVAAAEANLARLNELRGYQKVRAPFAGVITVRNIETGTLVTEANTMLFRIAQTGRLRTYVNVPQSEASSVHVGQPARLIVPDLRQQFTGTVTRTSNSLDAATRTLLTEVQVANPGGILMPGMYTDVDLTTPRKDPPLVIPGDTLVVRADGPQVALVTDRKTVHFQRIKLGRDYGDKLEVLGGLEAGQEIIVNPGDSIREGAQVNPVVLSEKPPAAK